MDEKTKLNCWIVDDEPLARSLLQRYVEKTPFLILTNQFGSGIEVLEAIHTETTPDVIFLDIQMADFNGIQVSQHLSKEIKIIFTTAFDQYAIEGYKVHAFDYLLKPIDYSDFLVSTSNLFKSLQKSKDDSTSAKEEELEYIFVKSEYKQLKIKLTDIEYIEGLKDYVKIYLIGHDSPILTLLSLKKLVDVLPSNKFMRIHRSFIIALDKISEVERNQVIIRAVRITIAEQYREDFKGFMAKRVL